MDTNKNLTFLFSAIITMVIGSQLLTANAIASELESGSLDRDAIIYMVGSHGDRVIIDEGTDPSSVRTLKDFMDFNFRANSRGKLAIDCGQTIDLNNHGGGARDCSLKLYFTRTNGTKGFSAFKLRMFRSEKDGAWSLPAQTVKYEYGQE